MSRPSRGCCTRHTLRFAEAGFRYLASHQDDEVTLRRLGAGWPYVGVRSGQLVATVTLRASKPDSACERLGYRFIQHVSWHETNYRSVVLSKSLLE